MDASSIRVEYARAADEPALRRLLREAPLPGRVAISLEREPDFHGAAAAEGERADVVVGRDGAGEVVALGARSVRAAWVNGAPARLGYLGLLRATGPARARLSAFRQGFALLAARRGRGELPFDLASISSDNAPARRLLEAGLPGLPTFRPLGELVTLSLVPGRPGGRRAARAAGAPDAGLAVSRGAPRSLAEIAAFLRREGPRRQLGPCPRPEAEGAPGPTPEDWLLVRRRGRLVAAGALWDQRGFKQAVVRGYSPALAAAGPLVRALGPVAPWLGLPALPRVGAPLAAAFLAFAAAEADEAAAFDALLGAALLEARARGLAALLLGLGAAHPLLPVARRRRHLAYRTTLYAVHRPDGAAAAAALDGRPLGPEVATL